MKTRVAKWDNLKAFLILCVVVGHVANMYVKESDFFRSIFSFTYFFHMPAFFFVSGLLSKRTIEQNRIGKVVPYLMLYFLAKFLTFTVLSVVRGRQELAFFSESELPWFVLALFEMYVITMCTKYFKWQYVLVWSLVFCFFVGYDTKIGDTMAFTRVINYYPFFYLGYLIDPELLEKRTSGMKWRIIGWTGLAILGIICLVFVDKIYLLRPLMTGRNPYRELGEQLLPWGGVLRMALMAVILLIIIMTIAAMPSKAYCFTKIGRRTLPIYVTHNVLLVILLRGLHIKEWIQKMLPYRGVWQISLLLIGVVLTVVCANPLFDYLIKKAMQPPKK